MQDHIPRGVHGYHWSRTMFALMRPFDPVICYGLLVLMGFSSSPRHLTVVGLVAIGAIRHVYWALHLHPHPLTASLALGVVLYNHSLDFFWTLMTCLCQLEGPMGRLQYIAISLHLFGSFIETYSEVQRKRFKNDKHNEGKLHTTGLFSIVQHVNYAGYILWRSALGLATGSIVCFLLSLHNLADFKRRGVPMLQEYLLKRYGVQKIAYDIKTPHKLIPGMW